MTEIWTIKGQAGKALDATVRTMSAIAAVKPRVVFRNLATDTLTWSIDLDGLSVGAELVPELGQEITLYRSSVRFFRGNVTGVAQRGRQINITVSGPWWWLERVFLESTLTDGTAATGTRATFVLPKQSLTTSLNSLLTAAKTLGVPLNVGTLATTFSAPELKLNQMSFAQAISEVLRITPDMVLAFDYATGTGDPDVKTYRRLAGLAAGSATPITLDGRDLEDFELNPVTELQISQVKVPYLSRATTGAKKFQVQSAGTAALGKVQLLTVSGDEMDTFLPKDLLDSYLLSTAALSPFDSRIVTWRDTGLSAIAKTLGYNPPYLMGGAIGSQVVTYAGFYPPSIGAPWYPVYRNFPAFSVIGEAGVEISTAGQHMIYSTDAPAWVLTEKLAKKGTVKGTWIYVEFAAAAASALYEALQAGAAWGSGKDVNNNSIRWVARPFTFEIYYIPYNFQTPATIYKASDYDFVSPPSGFADGLLATMNFIPYEGVLTLMDEECGATRFIPAAINVSNTLAAHATMKSMVSSEELDLEAGITTLTLGAPMRFSYRELVNKMRGSSTNNIVYL